MNQPDKRLRKAVEKLQRHYIHAVPFYREDGMEVVVNVQDVINGVKQEPFTMAIEVAGAGLRIQSSPLKWEDRETVVPVYPKVKRPKVPYLSDKFTVLDNPNPMMDQQFEYDEVVKFPPRQVWTVVEGDSGKLYAITGVHYVNRLHFAVTKEEWTDEDEEREYRW